MLGAPTVGSRHDPEPMSTENSPGEEPTGTKSPPQVVQDCDFDNPLSFIASEQLGPILERIEKGEATTKDLVTAISLMDELDSKLDEVVTEWAEA